MFSVKSALVAAAALLSSASAVDIAVKASGGNKTSGHQYGFLHEDINYSGDGGIYAELVRNRAFQFSPRYPVSLSGWQSLGGATLTLQNLTNPLSKNLPTSVKVAGSSGWIGLANEGYWGLDVRRQKYTGSFWVKGSYEGSFNASLRSNLTGEVFGSTLIKSSSKGGEWTEHFVELTPSKDAPNSNNTFAITFDAAGAKCGSLALNLISLFPPTFKNRKNGLRVDLAEALVELHPTTFRFPGGNMLEGDNNRSIWDWKDTLGPLRDRKGFQGVWGYQQTHGLGMMEYLYWAEDMGLELVLAVWGGLALNGDITAEADLQPFIDDALDQIEFVRGPATSKWGKRRAELGHPEPFKLEYVEVGNEDWLAGGTKGWESYKQYRFPLFYKAISAAYPDITVIASGATSDNMTNIPADALGDYHPYREPDALVREFNKFDNDKTGHIVGEVAATHPNGGLSWNGPLFTFPWWIGGVGEAISMIGYERNADRIMGTFYAPVMRNMNRWQWAVTMLQYAADPKTTTRSTSWHVWEILAASPMTETLPATKQFGPLYYVAGKNADKGTYIWKGAVYNTTDHASVPVSVAFEGVAPGAKAALRTLTGNGDPYAFNSPYTGVNIVNTTKTILTADAQGKWSFTLPELSVAVLDTDLSVGDGKRDH